MHEKKLERKLQQSGVQSVWSSMKKISGFKQEEDQTDGGLDNKVNVFSSRFSSGGSSASLCILVP